MCQQLTWYLPSLQKQTELVSAMGQGWICPLTRSLVSQEAEKGTAAPGHTWDVQDLGVSASTWLTPGKSCPSICRCEPEVKYQFHIGEMMQTFWRSCTQGWSLDSFRPMQCVSYSWNEKTWASAWAFITDQETNEAKNVSLIPWLLQFSAEFVPDLAHLMNASGGPWVRWERGNVFSGKKLQGNAVMLLFPIASPQSCLQNPCLGAHSNNTVTHQRPWELQSLAGTFRLCTGHSACMDNKTHPEGSSWLPLRTAFSHVEWSIFLVIVHGSVVPATLAWQPDLPVLLLIIALKKANKTTTKVHGGDSQY